MGRLSWKLFFSFWLAMMLSFGIGVTLKTLEERWHPQLLEEDMRHDRPILIPTLVGAGVSFFFSYGLAWYLSRPLRHLRWALHSVAQGHFATRVRPRMGRRRDEIVDLGEDFDAMADRLQQLIEARQRLLHDISHELRSPLTRMQVAIGLLRQDPARTAAMVERIDTEAQRLDAMVGEVLTLARLEQGGAVIAREKVDLIDLLAAIVEDAAFEAEATGRAVRFSSHGTFVTVVAAEILCRAFENIIRNAVKYTHDGTAVEVHAETGEDGILRVRVEDHGPGVPPEMLKKMFEPFVRLDATSGRSGFGLGLAIAQRAIESHGGKVWAESSPEGGLKVLVDLPPPDA